MGEGLRKSSVPHGQVFVLALCSEPCSGRKSGVPREQVFVTSKVRAEHKSYKEAAASIDETLAKTRLDYPDLMIIHNPQPWADWGGQNRYVEESRQVWRALEDAYREGKLRAIGVSDFLQDDLESLHAACGIRPMADQELFHAGSTPLQLLDYCREQDIQMEAYSPVAHDHLAQSETLAEIAARYGASPAQLSIRDAIQMGVVALPKSTDPQHMAQNAQIDFVIDDKDAEALKGLDFEGGYGEYSAWPVFNGKRTA